MERKKRAFYATDEEYKAIKQYAEERNRTVSNFALYAMNAEMSKTKNRLKNRRIAKKGKKVSLEKYR